MNEIENKNPENKQDITAGMDSGSKALADALKISFAVLKLIMIVLIILFFASGVYTVEKNEKAIVLRFGKVVRDASGTALKEPGLHWALPYPIDEIVKIPVTATQKLEIDDFWYFDPEQGSRPGRTLNPIRDGYCLTRNEEVQGYEDQLATDYNIVHCKWQLNWTIEDDPYAFFRNVKVRPVKPGELYRDVISESVEPLLTTVTDDAIVRTLAKYSIDQAVTTSKSNITREVTARVQERLRELSTGIRVRDMQILKITWPRQVDQAFLASIKAGQNRSSIETEAWTYYEKTLNEAGGPRAEESLEVLLDESSTEAEIRMAYSDLTGQASKNLSEARSYKTKVIETAKANANYLRQLLPEYRKRPELVIERIYQDNMEQILDTVDEKIIVQPAKEGKEREFRVLINRNPSIKDKKSGSDENQNGNQ
ncbi:protease modulator HflK [Sedimentisphaera salicampi]|uniref:protease modulator HflK n=1 Tax=Sedimentisphaera salicampi TaxID=1941349 RepID=UPI000B9C2728|nr:protease modulator HflK [Sedimentisphaera salicampi]OXU15803.1 Modulator of FtsH protease HflK [Sedimentisphaera salicampi]